jgi:hypothetical protein
MTSQEGLRLRGSFIWFRGKWGILAKKGCNAPWAMDFQGKRNPCKLTVFDDGGDLNCHSLLLRHLASIQGPSLLIIELKKDDPLQYMTIAVACTIAHL